LTEATCRLRGLTPDSQYFFVVSSVTKDGLESEFSGEVAAKPGEDTIENQVPADNATPTDNQSAPVKKQDKSLEQPF
jgi:hypothetical protein